VRGAILGLTVLVLLGVSIAAGIGIWKLTSGPEQDVTYQTSNSLPDYVYDSTAPKDAPTAYQAAIDHYEEFGKIPCYCGCGDSARHESLQDCFLESNNGANIVFDDHAAG
jgi:hypothetical protein